MKKIILLAASASFLCAGPLVQPIVDYDQQDEIIAEKEVEQKLTLPPAVVPEVTTPGVRKKSFNYELDLLAGRNFADSGTVLKDATTMGIRLNRFISDTVALQIGYDRIFDADYKFGKSARALHDKTAQTEQTQACSPGYCCTCTPCTPQESDGTTGDTGTENGYTEDNGGMEDTGSGNDAGTENGMDHGNGSYGGDTLHYGSDNGSSEEGAGNGSGAGSGNGSDAGDGDSGYGSGSGNGGSGNGGSGGKGTGNGGSASENPLSEKGVQNATRSTDVDRFYLNVVKELHSEKTRFIPYAFAGVGYEHVNDKNLGIDSQGFFNAGGGLKYRLGEKFRLVSEAKAIKKFKDSDLDIVAMVGVGMLLGEKEAALQQPDLTDLENAEPKPQKQDLSLVLLDEPSAPIVTPQQEAVIDRTPVVQQLMAEDKSPQKDVEVPVEDNAYYVQVAVVKTDSALDNYLKKLKAKGLPYEVKPVKVRGAEAHRVLTGPYLSRSEAQEDLKQVRSIERGAFIKKL